MTADVFYNPRGCKCALAWQLYPEMQGRHLGSCPERHQQVPAVSQAPETTPESSADEPADCELCANTRMQGRLACPDCSPLDDPEADSPENESRAEYGNEDTDA